MDLLSVYYKGYKDQFAASSCGKQNLAGAIHITCATIQVFDELPRGPHLL